MTDKMLSRKEGGVGYVIFNNPERHNAWFAFAFFYKSEFIVLFYLVTHVPRCY